MTSSGFSDADMPAGVEDVELAVFEGEAVLFRESTRMVHRLNSVAGAVWLLCDGSTPVGSMPGELAELFGQPSAALTDGVTQALHQLAEEGLLVGFEAPLRAHMESDVELAGDGSRILAVPPDP